MSMISVDDIDDQSILRSKRGQRKGAITRISRQVAGMSDGPLADVNIAQITQLRAALITQQEEFELFQNRLIFVMEQQSDTKSAALEKEREELFELIDRAVQLIALSSNLEDAAKTMKEANKVLKSIDRALSQLSDEAGTPDLDQSADLRDAKVKIGAAESLIGDLPEIEEEKYEDRIRGMRRRLTQLKTVFEAGRVPVDAAPAPVPGATGISAADLLRSRLPDVTFPKFSGDKLEWPAFWREFEQVLSKDKYMTEEDKILYLKRAVRTPEANAEFKHLRGAAGDYAIISKVLDKMYHNPRLMYRTAVQSLINGKLIDESDARAWSRTLAAAQREATATGQDTAADVFATLGELKLEGRLAKQWTKAAVNKTRKVPALGDLTNFLDDVAAQYEDELEVKQRSKRLTRPPPSDPATSKPKKQQVYLTQPEVTPLSAAATPYAPFQQRAKPPCKLCKVERHPMFLCPTFQSNSVPQRKEAVKRLKLCVNCLGYGHSIDQCRSNRTCRDCQHRHHSLLHEDTPEVPATSTPTQPRPTYLANANRDIGILPTAIVTVEANGKTVQARAILDVCSSASYVTTRLVQRLGASTFSQPISTTTVGNITGLQCELVASITIRPKRQHLSNSIPIGAHISKSVSMVLPTEPLPDATTLPFLSGLDLADPSFHLPGRIDLLLGSEATARMTHVGQTEARASEDGRFLAADTIYGWIVQGGGGVTQQAEVYLSQEEPHNPSTFWETEEIQPHHQSLSKNDTDALKHYQESHTREPDGRYTVSLPKKLPTPELGRSRMQAERRFDQNQRALTKKGRWEPFRAAVAEYGQLHHAELVPEADLKKPEAQCFYLPMHGVAKDSSTTTKLRIVFDASARTSNGMSLNDTLLAGPNQYPLTTEIILKFRRHNIGMTADISKMFREIGLNKEDRDLHRFLWKTEQDQTQIWRMTRVTFGVTSSPFLATQTLLQLAQDHEDEHPAAAQIIRNEFYVDDCLTGADTVEQAVDSRRQLNGLLKKGRMNLRKWRTNSEELQKSIPTDLCEEELDIALLTPSRYHKTLGIHWDTKTDRMFVSTPTLDDDRTATKRQISSDLARTYDVMGWFAPAMVVAKLLLQEIWVQGLDWDEPVPDTITNQWKQWTEELPLITQHPIPRCHHTPFKPKRHIQLHGFSDASEKAYGGVIYLRTLYEDTTISMALITAKTKVSPTTPMTVPKLELCGALLLSKLMENTARTLDIQQDQIYAWTDSTIVLGWLNQEPGKLKVYVSNRVQTITKRVPASNWRYVPTGDNPADVASRGLMPRELTTHLLWWDGPPWLKKDPSTWPKQPSNETVSILEVKKEFTALTTQKITAPALMNRYSSLKRLLRISAWHYRFVSNAKQKEPTRRSLENRLSAKELDDVEVLLVKGVQQRYYPVELEALQQKKELPAKSSILNLHPILSKDGILLVGGRLVEASLPELVKHPRILPRRSRLTYLIMRHLHLSNHHAGPSVLIDALSQRYHVSSARSLARHVTNRCVPCRKAYARKATQLMGQLPIQRTTASSTFSHVGVDLAGPMTLKYGNPRKPRIEKAYVCLFVCMATKAIHLEVVSDLSTEAFMATFQRFVSRRGVPTMVYSDNGTNFVGADRSLKQAYECLHSKDTTNQVQKFLADQKVTWSHIPELAPHFGGLWESNIKSAKTLLRTIAGTTPLTYERLTTFLCQAESIMNSRPLVPLDAQSPDSELVLTPGHFLIGRPLTSLPDISHVLGLGTQTNRARWNHCRQLTEHFWSHWTNTYITTLNRFNKWTRPKRNVRVGDVVLVKDKFLFVNQWPLARVIQVHPGTDGLVRAATVRGQTCGTHKRPIVKLVVLIPEEEAATFPPPGGWTRLRSTGKQKDLQTHSKTYIP